MNVRAYQISIGILVLIVAVLSWMLVATRRAGESTERLAAVTASTTATTEQPSDVQGTSTPTQTNDNTIVASDSVSAADQSAGMSVAVQSVTVSAPSWIAVRDSSGRTLGAALVGTGTHADVTVPLLRGTEAGGKYQLLVYVDNGDKQFDLHSDSLVTNADGTVAGATFTAK